MRILLTGAGGFIGAAIVEQLDAAGHEVVGLDSYLEDAHGPAVQASGGEGVTVGDVRDEDLLVRLLDGIDVVCHQAAMVGLGVSATDAPKYASHNVLGTATLLSAMARTQVRRLVLASSMVVYGEGRYRCPDHGPTSPPARSDADLAAGRFDPPCHACGRALEWLVVSEDSPLDPRNTYAATKLAQEHLTSAWCRQVGGAATALRYHNVYGPGMPRDTPYAGVASIFRSALESGRAPQVLEDGHQMRDFIHVADIARANLLAITAISAMTAGAALRDGGGRYDVFNVCSGEPHSVGELATALAVTMGGPAPVVVGGGRPGDVRHVVADPARARSALGFAAAVPFEDGVAEFAHAPMRASATSR